MLCTCSGEKFQIEDAPRSPESLATRDFSANGNSSSRVTDLDSDSKFDDGLVDEVESALRDTISLNYEEARALLGRLEYQRGNFDASLQVLQGIDIVNLRPKMIKSISSNSNPRLKKVRSNSKSEKLKLPNNVMSVHSVSLLLEAVFVKAKSYEALGKPIDSAMEYKNIIDIVENAWPYGTPVTVGEGDKILEIFHKSLESLPKLWIQGGCFEEAITAYKRALTKTWKLNPGSCASLQKDLAIALLYTSTNNNTTDLEEAILLLLILMKKLIFKEINLDYEIINHLIYALSVSNQYEILANQIEMLLPGLYNREERWYFLALCYYGLNMNNDALNIVRNSVRVSERKNKFHVPTLILGAKICYENLNGENAFEGVKLATRVLEYTKYKKRYIHQIGMVYHFLGGCLGFCSRSSNSNLEKSEKNALNILSQALLTEKDNPKILYTIARENAMQRNPNLAVKFGTKYLNSVLESDINGWKLLIILISMQRRFKEAEGVLDIAMDEIDELGAKLEFLKLKAKIRVSQGDFKGAIDSYRVLFSMVKSYKEANIWVPDTKVAEMRNIETEAWLDLASIYTNLNSYQDAKICLDNSNSVQFSSPKYWHIKGTLFKAQLMEKEALNAFSTSLSMDPDYVPSLVSISNILTQGGKNCLSLARSFITSAVKLEGTNHDTWLNLGLVYENEGCVIEAAHCFQMAFELEQTAPVQNL